MVLAAHLERVKGLIAALAARALGGRDRNVASLRQFPSLRQFQRDQIGGLLGSTMFMAGVWLAYKVFTPLMPPARLMAFITATIIWQCLWVPLNVIAFIRKPSPSEIERFWWPVGNILPMALVCIMIWSVWLFMPYASGEPRLIYVLLSVTFVSVSIMSGSDALNQDRFSAIGVLGSMAAWFLLNGGPYALVLAGFVIAYALAMLSLIGNLRHSSKALAQAKRAAEAQRDAKARFIASASHDLGQPLQAARLFFEQVIRSEDGTTRTKAVRGVNWSFDTTEQLLKQMLDHLQLEAGAVRAEMRDIAIGPLIAQIAEVNEPASRLADVRITAMPSQLRVLADHALIERALGNFVGNALRHAKAKRVLIGARVCLRRVRLWVIDDGVGIAAPDFAHLFDDYVQGSDHADEVRGGFGLGLASARRMAELMGGSAGLDTRWSSGSAFWIELAGVGP